jgi:hypothetical protein
VARAILPALSVQLPLAVAARLFGPEYFAVVHDAMPEKALPRNLKRSGWLYQPWWSGGRRGTADAVGFEISTLMGCVDVPWPDGPCTVQDTFVFVSWA